MIDGQFDESFEFIMERINKSFKIEKKQRQEHWEVPPIAIREVLMNAILHRNYHLISRKIIPTPCRAVQY